MTKSNQELRQKISVQIGRYIRLRRTHDFLISAFSKGTGKLVQNELLYDIQRFAWDGLSVRLKNYIDNLIGFLGEVQTKHLKDIPRNRREEIREHVDSTCLRTPFFDEEALRMTKILGLQEAQLIFTKTYDDFFPGVKVRKAGFPNNADIKELIEKLIEVREAIKRHRDTVVAHEDKIKKPISIDELKQTFEYLERFLREFFFVATNNNHSFKLLGGSDLEATAEMIVKATIGSEQQTN